VIYVIEMTELICYYCYNKKIYVAFSHKNLGHVTKHKKLEYIMKKMDLSDFLCVL